MRLLSAIFLLLALTAGPASATWSIVAVDTETQEVVVGGATCLTNFDLRALLPAVVVGRGAGSAQSLIDSGGARRIAMRDGLLGGTTSDAIMQQLIGFSGSSNHQNGLADAGGDSATFSGSSTGAHSSGVTGSFGTVHYAIQGNVLAGRPVVLEAETALVSTTGDLPEKLMAAMEAARDFGGDGRCSCSSSSPTACGSPPASFTKSAHIGFLIVARVGDTDGVCSSSGCAQGDYYLDLNFPFQSASAPDPVNQLRGAFDSFRQGLEGRPDAIASVVTFEPVGDDFRLVLDARDHLGVAPSTAPAVTITHRSDSARATDIGPVQSQGGGRFAADLSRNGGSGLDRFEIVLDDGVRPVVVPPKRAELLLSGGGGGGGLTEDFENGLGGWTTSGLWHLVTDSPCASPGYSSPVNAVYYGQDSTCTYDAGDTSGDLLSPPITGIGPASNLTFQFFRQVESFSGGSFDRAEVAVAAVGSGTFTTVFSLDSTDPSSTAFGSSGPISLAAFAGQDIQVRFRFDSIDNQFNGFTGWIVDDVVVTADSGGGGGCQTLHQADFESGSAGWTHSVAQSTCTTGDWLVGDPDPVTNSGVQLQLGDDNTSAGVNAFFTQPNGGGAGSDDVDGGVCTGLSPVIDAQAFGSVEVSLAYYHGQRDAGDDPGGDLFRIDVSTDGGSTFTTNLVSLGDARSNAAWTPLTVTVNDPGQLQIRVQAADGAGPGDLVEGGIDDVKVCAPQ